jgi:ABC-type transport system involved in cytochrome bd biosynthesis fused ATPase/permease subunit
MDKFNFTPGPWRIVPTNSGLYIAGSVPGYFCEMRDCSSTYHVADNARAIAALPELVAALEECFTETPGAACFNTGKKTRRLEYINSIVSAALAKVRG